MLSVITTWVLEDKKLSKVWLVGNYFAKRFCVYFTYFVTDHLKLIFMNKYRIEVYRLNIDY